MMTIENVFREMRPWLKGIKVAENFNLLEVDLKITWKVPQKNDGIQLKKGSANNGFISVVVYSDSLDFDTMIDWLKTSVIDYNLEIEEKERLLKTKIDELKEVFSTKDLDELNKLTFTTEGDILDLKNNKKEKMDSNGVTKELSQEEQST